MAWTTMHFAMGMGCAGLAGAATCSILRRGWRWLPAAMTVGGFWALAPDLPRIFREDFPSLPFAAMLGQKSLERWLHSHGNVFFFHQALDAQPHEYALHGFILVLLFYNLAIGLLMHMERRQRQSMGNRAWRARRVHRLHQRRLRRRAPCAPVAAAEPGYDSNPDLREPDSPIVARIRSSHLQRSG